MQPQDAAAREISAAGRGCSPAMSGQVPAHVRI